MAGREQVNCTVKAIKRSSIATYRVGVFEHSLTAKEALFAGLLASTWSN
jgi:hypothetical protein